MNQLFVIDGVSVAQLEPGMYRLNDLHQAAILSGANKRTKEPGKFLSSPKTIALISKVKREEFNKVHRIRGGLNQGTYACREILLAYAIWVDADFYAKVLQSLSLVEHFNKGGSQ